MVLEGTDPRILGLFSGVPMPDQSVLGPPSGSVIQLLQRNLERDARDEQDLADEIRITVLHETAHYFGAGEQDMHRFGLN
jgi:predicted Zn-dependent protease with MMP-like domain